MSSFDDLPGRGNNHSIEEKAEAAFSTLLGNCEHFILQRADRKDYGSDCQIEVLDDGHPTNVRLHVQLKGTESDLNSDGSLSRTIERTNFNYLITPPYSQFVAYHVPTDTLLIASVGGMLRDYEHKGTNWIEQDTLTVKFREKLTLDRLSQLAGLARSAANVDRDRRIAEVRSADGDLPISLRFADDFIHVPDDQAAASRKLKELYENGADAKISGAFDQFSAILGGESDEMSFCYMAEINLGMSGHSRFPERIKAGITHLDKQIGGGRCQEGSIHYSIGNAYSALGNEKAAKNAYQEAAADTTFMADPGMAAQCLKNMGSSFERLGNEDTAAHLYRGAIEMSPQLPEAHFALGRHHHRRGEFDQALKHYDSVVFTERELGRSSTILGWRLNALFNIGAIREAYRSINLLLAEAEAEPWIWSWCARQVAAFNNTSVEAAQGAYDFWQRYVKAHPTVFQARINLLLTQFYLRQEGQNIGKDYCTFREEFGHQIVGVDPEQTAYLWDRLGHWAQDDKNWSEAERCFRKAYEIDGGHFGYCLGVALNFLERYEEALPLLVAQAKGIQPDEMSWFQVGLTNAKLGRTKESVEAYRKSLALDSDYPLAMFNLAGTLWNSGDHDQAAIVFRTAAQQFPEHELTAKLHRDFPELFSDMGD